MRRVRYRACIFCAYCAVPAGRAGAPTAVPPMSAPVKTSATLEPDSSVRSAPVSRIALFHSLKGSPDVPSHWMTDGMSLSRLLLDMLRSYPSVGSTLKMSARVTAQARSTLAAAPAPAVCTLGVVRPRNECGILLRKVQLVRHTSQSRNRAKWEERGYTHTQTTGAAIYE